GAAQRLRLGPFRSGAQAPGWTGVGAGAVWPLANVVRQSERAAREPPQALAAGIDGSWSQLLRPRRSRLKATSIRPSARSRRLRWLREELGPAEQMPGPAARPAGTPCAHRLRSIRPRSRGPADHRARER